MQRKYRTYLLPLIMFMFICLSVCVRADNVKAAGFTETSASIDVSESVTIYADADTSIKQWESSDESIAVIGSNTTKKCTVEPRKEGTVVIKGTSDDGSVASFTLTIALKKLEVDKTDITLGIKGTTEEAVTVTYGGERMYYGYSYESADPDIAYVDNYSDYIRAKGVGKTTVKITSKYGQELMINVTVLPEYNYTTPVPATMTPTAQVKTTEGASTDTSAVTNETDQNQTDESKQSPEIKMIQIKGKINTKKITGKLSVNDATVKIKVGSNSYKTAKVKGSKFTLGCGKLTIGTKIRIKATANDYKAFDGTYYVSRRSEIPKNSPDFVDMTHKKKLTAHVNTRVDYIIKNARGTVKWSSSNPKVATVNKDGTVKGKKIGSTVLKAEVGGKTYSCKLVVKELIKITRAQSYIINYFANYVKSKYKSAKLLTSYGKKYINADGRVCVMLMVNYRIVNGFSDVILCFSKDNFIRDYKSYYDGKINNLRIMYSHLWGKSATQNLRQQIHYNGLKLMALSAEGTVLRGGGDKVTPALYNKITGKSTYCDITVVD